MPLGHGTWESYCAVEFGISRAQAYRLPDVAHSLTAIHGAVTAGTETSRAVSGRSGDVAEITRRLAALAHNGLQALDEATVRAVVRQAVRDI
ncbi:hypothetical protein [Streptomyces sp. NPDC093260]|uniref:hypothetical protein n=1 Tax=Streptomyces sp. NPDC093260 TaxID=3155073 RepID=UPI003412ED71